MQPWAELLVIPGAKEFETRPMRINYRGTLLIHAGMKFDFGDLELCHSDKRFNKFIPDPTKLVTGAIIGKVDIIECLPVEEALKVISATEKAFGDYRPGRYAWMCAGAVKFKKPILGIRGQQGIWNYDLSEAEEMEVCNG